MATLNISMVCYILVNEMLVNISLIRVSARWPMLKFVYRHTTISTASSDEPKN